MAPSWGVSGCGSVWLERLVWVQENARSNRVTPISSDEWKPSDKVGNDNFRRGLKYNLILIIGDNHNSSGSGFDPEYTGAAPVSPANWMKVAFHLAILNHHATFGSIG